MPGRIRAEDIELVKERTSLEDVVREHVTLRPAGGGSLKGLCPFHDEKSPSFNMRPHVGYYHCFGCGKSGDVFTFVQEVDHLSFAEAVERLAAKAGIILRYEEGGARDDAGGVRRIRLVEAHRAAAEFYIAQLRSPEARPARDFLRDKGFDGAACEPFGVGYAPRDGMALVRDLRGRGFTDEELTVAGLAGQGRGVYDRFRGRVMWPIRDTTGDTIGFGARRIFDDDRIAAKYLNTAETPIYKKANVLYGLDLAKKSMASTRRAVIVEGYTDVMACHLAGVEQAVATCGTAFGAEHLKTLRRIVRDEADQAPARIVFTFDGDAAGQNAAMKAFELDQQWAAQSYVAVAPAGQDPCELRQSAGDAAVRGLVEDAAPMFEFAVRTTIARFDLAAAQDRVAAMRAVAPILAGIRDSALRPEYVRAAAGWLGVDIEQLATEVGRAGRGRAASRPAPAREEEPPPPDDEEDDRVPAPDLRNPVVQLERQLLQVLLQYPQALSMEQRSAVGPADFSAPAHAMVWGAAGDATGLSTAAWVQSVVDRAPHLRGLVVDLAVADLPVRLSASGEPDWRYVQSLVVGLHEASLKRQVDEAMSRLRRTDDPDASRAIAVRLAALQRELSELKASVEP